MSTELEPFTGEVTATEERPPADSEPFLVGPEEEAELLAAIEEADSGQLISGDELLAEIRAMS